MSEYPIAEAYDPETMFSQAIDRLREVIHSPLIPPQVQRGYEQALTDIHLVDDEEYRRVISEDIRTRLKHERDIEMVTQRSIDRTNAITLATISTPQRPIYVKRSYMEQNHPPVEEIFDLLAEEISHANYIKTSPTQLTKAKDKSMKIFQFLTVEDLITHLNKARSEVFNIKKSLNPKDISIHLLGFRHIYVEKGKHDEMYQYVIDGQMYLEEMRAGIMQIILEILREGKECTSANAEDILAFGINALTIKASQNLSMYYKESITLPLLLEYLYSKKFTSSVEAMQKLWIGLYSKTPDNFLDDLDYAYTNLSSVFLQALEVYAKVNTRYHNTQS